MTPSEKARKWLDQNALILDTETTGLDGNAEIVEISIIDCQGNIVLDTLVRPQSPIPFEATEIHGISDAMVTEASYWPDIIREFEACVADQQLVIYNASYDLRIIRQTCNKWHVPRHVLPQADCAMEAYAEFYGEWNQWSGGYRWQKLTAAAAQQNVIVEGQAHRALADCRMTLGVIQAMARKAPAEV